MMPADEKTKCSVSTGPPLETYTHRLFGKGVYGRHHNRRYDWLRHRISTLSGDQEIRILEVGCFEGRVLDFIPRPVRRYVGFDAGWGGGIERARKAFQDRKEFSFIQSHNPKDIAGLEEKFDFAIWMETLEHIDPPLVEHYIKAFSEKIDGFLLVTVPNEKGIALLIKMLGAKVLKVDRIYPYTLNEVFWGILGRLDRVDRSEHKGFDYGKLAKLIGKYFNFVFVEGVSPVRRPLQVGLTIGIVASQKSIRIV